MSYCKLSYSCIRSLEREWLDYCRELRTAINSIIDRQLRDYYAELDKVLAKEHGIRADVPDVDRPAVAAEEVRRNRMYNIDNSITWR